MSSFEIGLTGLDAARKGLDVIGNNIANASTDGYHRQRIELTAAYARYEGGILIGGGVDVSGVTRLMDSFIEQEILRQKSALGQVSQESSILGSIESAFGELTGSTGLNAAIDQFFNSLSDLSAHPDQAVYQNEVLTSGESMAARFRTLGDFLNNLKEQILQQAQNVVGQVNTLAGQVAKLNDNIQRIEMGGGQANNLKDQRDELISRIAELAGVQTQQRDYGVVDVDVGGVPVVTGATTMQLEVGLNNEGLLGITPAGAFTYQTTIQGGQIGGLLDLYNTTAGDIQSDLDTLAHGIIQQFNQCHVQGVGSDGSFTELTGWTMTSENLSDFVPPLSDGSIFIRVTDTATGEITRRQIDIDPATDSLTTVAEDISGITGLTATVSGNRLSIQADSTHKFDFLPAVLSTPSVPDFSGDSPPTVSVSGIYTGDENLTFTFTVVGNDEVGNGNLQLHIEAKDKDDNVVDIPINTLNIGSGYAAGDQLDFGYGIKIAISVGDFNAADNFEIDAYANTDTSGLLSAVGINTFFSGSGASDMALAGNMVDSPGRVATSLGAGMTDNTNALRLASVGEQEITELDSMTAGDFYRKLVTGIGQQVSVKQMSQSSIENLVQTLTNQQSEISGVDINEEAAQMLVFEQMFQAMAKYLNTINSTLTTLMEMV